MIEQEKKILLKYLCASLPYDTIVNVDNGKYREDMKLRPYHIAAFNNWDIKPYLRPISSMTEKEKIELKEYLDAEEVDCNGFGYIEGGTLEDYISRISYSLCNYVIDWLKSKYFDYCGLIPMGLALPAPEGMYK